MLSLSLKLNSGKTLRQKAERQLIFFLHIALKW